VAACLIVTVLGLGIHDPGGVCRTIAELFGGVHRWVVVVRSLETDVPTEEGPGKSVSSIGSDVLISPGDTIVTAAHLVHAASEITVEFWDGKRVPARVVSSAPGAEVPLPGSW
jgi:S1-C subfamily serine protease